MKTKKIYNKKLWFATKEIFELGVMDGQYKILNNEIRFLPIVKNKDKNKEREQLSILSNCAYLWYMDKDHLLELDYKVEFVRQLKRIEEIFDEHIEENEDIEIRKIFYYVFMYANFRTLGETVNFIESAINKEFFLAYINIWATNKITEINFAGK